MIKKVYVAKEEDLIRFEAKRDFGEVKFLDCTEIEFEKFKTLFFPTLFSSSKDITCLLNIDEYQEKDLLDYFISIKIQQDLVLAFKSLPKNHKLYKYLNSKCEIEHCEGLDTIVLKRKFIKDLIGKSTLLSQLQDTLVNQLPENKNIILNEVEKLKHHLTVETNIEVLKEGISKYESSFDLFEYINSLLDADYKKAYLLAEKVASNTASQLVYCLLLKKVLSMICFTLKAEELGNQFWRSGPYYQNITIQKAKRIGKEELVELYNFIDNNFNYFYLSDKDLFLSLVKLILYFKNNILFD
jgi:hypothetical protein